MYYPTLPKEPVAMADEILTVVEVAQLLKVAEKTVYTMAQKGELPAFKVRGQWRFKRDDIDAWIEGQKAAARAEPQPGPGEEK
jgi:excisionase family DNA binding protein